MNEEQKNQLLADFDRTCADMLLSLFRAGAVMAKAAKHGDLEKLAAAQRLSVDSATKMMHFYRLGNELMEDMANHLMAKYDVASIQQQATNGASNGQ